MPASEPKIAPTLFIEELPLTKDPFSQCYFRRQGRPIQEGISIELEHKGRFKQIIIEGNKLLLILGKIARNDGISSHVANEIKIVKGNN